MTIIRPENGLTVRLVIYPRRNVEIKKATLLVQRCFCRACRAQKGDLAGCGTYPAIYRSRHVALRRDASSVTFASILREYDTTNKKFSLQSRLRDHVDSLRDDTIDFAVVLRSSYPTFINSIASVLSRYVEISRTYLATLAVSCIQG